MLKKLLLLILFFFILFSQKSYADGVEFNKRQWELGLYSLAPSYLLHITLHEGSHALAAGLMGATITDFRIWPLSIENKLFFGYTNTEKSPPFSSRQSALFSLAPQITNALMFCAAETLFYCNAVSSQSSVAPLVFVFGELMPWIDFTLAFINSGDIENLEKKSKVPNYITRPVGGIMSAIGAYFLIKRGYQIFFQKHRHKPKYKKLCKFSIEGGAGIMLTYHF